MESAKPVDLNFTKALPKVELHAHLSGSISRRCLHEIWLRKKRENLDFAVEDPWVSMPPGKVDYGLDTFFQVFSKSIYQLCSDIESLKYATASVLQDFQDDGVRYLELRTTPRASPANGISKEEYITTVLDTIAAFTSNTKKCDMSVFLILSIDRSNTLSEALEVVDLALKHRSRGIVGIDLCGNPSKGDVSIFADAFAKAKANSLRITLHFAETAFSGSLVELETLLSFQPDRLGHVIYVPASIRDQIARQELGLELCLSCNVHAKMINGSFPDHHFGYYWNETACPISLCTDDVGFFCSPGSEEYLLAARHFNLSRKQIINLCYRALSSIFGGVNEQARLKQLLAQFENDTL